MARSKVVSVMTSIFGSASQELNCHETFPIRKTGKRKTGPEFARGTHV